MGLDKGSWDGKIIPGKQEDLSQEIGDTMLEIRGWINIMKGSCQGMQVASRSQRL